LAAIRDQSAGETPTDKHEESVDVELFMSRLEICQLYFSEHWDNLKQRLKLAGPFDSGQTVGEWLISHGELKTGQLQILLKGSSCPLVLGSYEVLDELDELGAGGMGQVYRALHREMLREVAIKTLKKVAAAGSDSAQRFQREVQAAARLVHPNVVVAHDAGEASGVRYLAMEIVEGADLSSVVRNSGTMTVSLAVDCICQAATGLGYAHENGVVHRDVKPGNLLLSNDGVVKVLDLGLARFQGSEIDATTHENEPLTSANMVMGTADYMSPEQATSTRAADERSDIYSLGCTLHFLLTGRPVFPASTVWQTLSYHQEKDVPSLFELREDVPSELDSVFQKMLAKKLTDRFQSMAEVRAALQEIDLPDSSSSFTSPGSGATNKSSARSALFQRADDTTSRVSSMEADETVLISTSALLHRTKTRIVAATLAGLFLAVAIAAVWINRPGNHPDDIIDEKTAEQSSGDVQAGGTVISDINAGAELDGSIVAQRNNAITALWSIDDEAERERQRTIIRELRSTVSGRKASRRMISKRRFGTTKPDTSRITWWEFSAARDSVIGWTSQAPCSLTIRSC
jgi:serine/threonine protein kinase